jgi:hypothetical protein
MLSRLTTVFRKIALPVRVSDAGAGQHRRSHRAYRAKPYEPTLRRAVFCGSQTGSPAQAKLVRRVPALCAARSGAPARIRSRRHNKVHRCFAPLRMTACALRACGVGHGSPGLEKRETWGTRFAQRRQWGQFEPVDRSEARSQRNSFRGQIGRRTGALSQQRGITILLGPFSSCGHAIWHHASRYFSHFDRRP